VEADLIGQLRDLSGVHRQALPPETLDPLEKITVILRPDSDGSGRYVFDVPQFLERAALDGKTRADLVIEFYDRPDQNVSCRLEDLPNDIETLDPDNLPNWSS
jgi:hypothetical protein